MRRTVALSLICLMFAALDAFAAGEARITGKITDGATKQPIADATVTVVSAKGSGKNFKQEFKTNKKGEYAVFLLDGTIRYDFTFSAAGYQPYVENMKLRLGEPNIRDIVLNSTAAIEAASAPKEAKPDPAIVAYNEGAALANDGKVAEAAAKMEEALAAKPDFPAANEALARIYLRQKEYAKAIDHANKSLAVDADNADMTAILYEAYTATGDKVKAAEYKKKMPTNPRELFNDAAKLINANKDSEAEPLLKQAIAADDKFAIAYYELGMIYVRGGKSAEARENLQKYLALEPNGKDSATAKEMLKYVK